MTTSPGLDTDGKCHYRRKGSLLEYQYQGLSSIKVLCRSDNQEIQSQPCHRADRGDWRSVSLGLINIKLGQMEENKRGMASGVLSPQEKMARRSNKIVTNSEQCQLLKEAEVPQQHSELSGKVHPRNRPQEIWTAQRNSTAWRTQLDFSEGRKNLNPQMLVWHRNNTSADRE